MSSSTHSCVSLPFIMVSLSSRPTVSFHLAAQRRLRWRTLIMLNVTTVISHFWRSTSIITWNMRYIKARQMSAAVTFATSCVVLGKAMVSEGQGKTWCQCVCPDVDNVIQGVVIYGGHSAHYVPQRNTSDTTCVGNLLFSFRFVIVDFDMLSLSLRLFLFSWNKTKTWEFIHVFLRLWRSSCHAETVCMDKRINLSIYLRIGTSVYRGLSIPRYKEVYDLSYNASPFLWCSEVITDNLLTSLECFEVDVAAFCRDLIPGSVHVAMGLSLWSVQVAMNLVPWGYRGVLMSYCVDNWRGCGDSNASCTDAGVLLMMLVCCK